MQNHLLAKPNKHDVLAFFLRLAKKIDGKKESSDVSKIVYILEILVIEGFDYFEYDGSNFYALVVFMIY